MSNTARPRQISPQVDASETPVVTMAGLSMEFPSAFGTVRALENVTLEVSQQEFFSIVGPSGCGKSTLLLLIAGLLVPSAGQLLVGGRHFSGPYTDAAIVFQQDNLLEWRTIADNVLLPAEIRRFDLVPYRRRSRELLATVGLDGFERSYPYQLSGGMRQRAALCRALVCDLPLLLMDEPFGALDALSREEHQVMLQHVWLQQRKTVVFVTHDIREAVLLSDRVAVMSSRPGRIRDIISIDLPRPRSQELTEGLEFNQYVGRIRRLLDGARQGSGVPS